MNSYNTGSVINSLRKRLESFALYEPTQSVHAVNVDDNFHIGYHETEDSLRSFINTGFDIQVNADKRLCDILHFFISKEYRRRKYGTQLYSIIESFCIEEFRCKRFATSASGEAAKGFWEAMGFDYKDKERFSAEKIIK